MLTTTRNQIKIYNTIYSCFKENEMLSVIPTKHAEGLYDGHYKMLMPKCLKHSHMVSTNMSIRTMRYSLLAEEC